MVLSQNAKQQQMQQQRQMQMQAPNQQMGQGSQANPVDITTPSVPVMNSNIPQFAQQPAGANISQLPLHQRQGSSSSQTNLQQQWQQHQQHQQGQQAQGQQQGKPGQMIPQIQQSVNRSQNWAGQDFSKEPFPVPEEKFMVSLASMLGAPTIQPPLVQGKVVDLYALFNLVHRNGGSVKVSIDHSTLRYRSDGMADLHPARRQCRYLVVDCWTCRVWGEHPIRPCGSFIAQYRCSNRPNPCQVPLQTRRHVLHKSLRITTQGASSSSTARFG